MKNKDNKQNSKILINGSYSILLTVLLLAGLIIVNLIVNHLPVKVTQFDFSNEKLYTLTGYYDRNTQKPGSGCGALLYL